MALYHFSVKQVSRGKGQTVVNSAAYISGQKLYNDYYGQTHDYTKKSGVGRSPAPPRLKTSDYRRKMRIMKKS